jgi:type II secretory pathway pseudopilin PulG
MWFFNRDNSTPTDAGCGRAVFAWTLIEVLGLVTVISILSAFLLPAVVRQIDKVVAEQETSILNSFSTAFQQYVMTTRTIPDQTSWASAIASKIGSSANDVLYNVRQQAQQATNSRVFLIDPSLQLGSGGGLPYTQSNFLSGIAGSPMLPQNPRVMIVSSLGKPLPAAVTNGVYGSVANGYFTNLWNAVERTVPSDTAWSGWTGRAEDVIVQRVNLSPLFVRLLLNKYNTSSYGYYTVDGTDGTTAPTSVTNVDGYFIQGSVLTLYTNAPGTSVSYATNIDTKLILNSDTSLVFEQGKWRGYIEGASTGNGAADAGDIVSRFLAATPNTNAAQTFGNAQQVIVVGDMLAFMSNYNIWAYSNNFDKNAAIYKTTLQNLEPTMMSDMRGLYQYQNFKRADGSYCCYPTNGDISNCGTNSFTP